MYTQNDIIKYALQTDHTFTDNTSYPEQTYWLRTAPWRTEQHPLKSTRAQLGLCPPYSTGKLKKKSLNAHSCFLRLKLQNCLCSKYKSMLLFIHDNLMRRHLWINTPVLVLSFSFLSSPSLSSLFSVRGAVQASQCWQAFDPSYITTSAYRRFLSPSGGDWTQGRVNAW